MQEQTNMEKVKDIAKMFLYMDVGKTKHSPKIIVWFPEELIRLNPELNQEYVYEFPEAIKTEEYEFNIPLDTLGGVFVIEVEAWKDDRKLTEELALPIRTNGSIVDELRTRIRDNGI